jgi:hypothetical protein
VSINVLIVPEDFRKDQYVLKPIVQRMFRHIGIKECDPKERYYDPYVTSRGLASAPYEGREILGLEAAQRYKRIRARCPQDVRSLESRLLALLESD